MFVIHVLVCEAITGGRPATCHHHAPNNFRSTDRTTDNTPLALLLALATPLSGLRLTDIELS